MMVNFSIAFNITLDECARANKPTNQRMLSLNHANHCINEERVERTTQRRKLHPALCVRAIAND